MHLFPKRWQKFSTWRFAWIQKRICWPVWWISSQTRTNIQGRNVTLLEWCMCELSRSLTLFRWAKRFVHCRMWSYFIMIPNLLDRFELFILLSITWFVVLCCLYRIERQVKLACRSWLPLFSFLAVCTHCISHQPCNFHRNAFVFSKLIENIIIMLLAKIIILLLALLFTKQSVVMKLWFAVTMN